MDRLANLTRGLNDTTPKPNCLLEASSSFLLHNYQVTTPSWESVGQELRWLFPLHVYAFAFFFFILSFYTFLSFINLRSLISIPPLMSSINVFLCLLGASRCISFLVDPYGIKEIMPKLMGSILWDIGFPFVISAFCLMQLAFFQITQVKFGLERYQKKTYLSLMIIFHLTCVIMSDTSRAFHLSYVLSYVVESIFLVWALGLFATFLYASHKVKLLLRNLPSSLLARDSASTNQKGIMQLAILAPYNKSLASSVAAALVPTLLGPATKLRSLDDSNHQLRLRQPANAPGANQQHPDTNPSLSSISYVVAQQRSKPATMVHQDSLKRRLMADAPTSTGDSAQPIISTVPEVYVRPPTPTPSLANLPIITVSSPSRRSSLASRRGSDVSRTSRRASECSVRFVGEDEVISPAAESTGKRSAEINAASPRSSPVFDRSRSPETGILRRNSDCPSPTSPSGSSRDLRRCSDFGQDCNGKQVGRVSSQFANKLRRNSDFGNRTPRRHEPDQSTLAKILDVSPVGSRRNSDLGVLSPTPRAVESRRNSDVSCRSTDRRSSDLGIRGPASRRSSDTGVRVPAGGPDDSEAHLSEIKSESDSEQQDGDCGSEKVALVNGGSTNEEPKTPRKKNLSWKSDRLADDQEDITPETSLLKDATAATGITGADFTLHSILNHIAYVNRARSDMPLHIPEASTAAARRSQLRKVLNVTYATAILGILLCVADVARIFGPYGLLADSIKYGAKPVATQYPKPLPWIIYQTVCRFLELIMGCAMASITKQPSASPRHQYLSNYPNYHLRDNLFI